MCSWQRPCPSNCLHSLLRLTDVFAVWGELFPPSGSAYFHALQDVIQLGSLTGLLVSLFHFFPQDLGQSSLFWVTFMLIFESEGFIFLFLKLIFQGLVLFCFAFLVIVVFLILFVGFLYCLGKQEERCQTKYVSASNF